MFHLKITNKSILVLLLSLPIFANAHPRVDVYGTDEKTAAKIIENFGNNINLLAQCVLEDPQNQSLGCKPENRAKAKEKITTGIKKLKNFQAIYFSSIYYGNQSLFTTVDVIESADQKRLNFFPKEIKAGQLTRKIKSKRDENLENLLASWRSYSEQGEALFHKGIQFDEEKNCSAYHCLYDFTHPDLKNYKEIFEKEVPPIQQ